MEIKLTLTITGIDTPEKAALLQARLEEVVKLIPHHYQVFQDSGSTKEILGVNVMSDCACDIQ